MSGSDELPPVSRELRAMLDAVRSEPGGTDEDRARVRRRLLATIGLAPPHLPGSGGGGGAGGSTGVGGSTAGAGGALSVTKAILLLGVVAASGGTYLALRSPAESPKSPRATPTVVHTEPPPVVASPPAVELIAVDASPPSSPGVKDAPARRAPRSPAAPAAAAAENRSEAKPATEASEREHQLIRSAWSALASEDAGSALRLVARHEREFARGALTEEREAVRIRALVLAGAVDEARSRAEDFARAFPRSIHLEAVRADVRKGE